MSKRIISLILAIAVMLSLCTMVSAAYSQDETGAYELGILKAIGIVGSEVNTSDVITRGSILSIMLKLANYDDITYDISQIYSDVPLTSSYASDVYMATSLGIISGSTDGNFYPDNPLNSANAVKMLVCVMGYGKKAEAVGGYPSGYYSVARSLKMKISGSENLTMGDLSVMIYSLLDVRTAEISGVADDGYVSYKSGKTLLEQMDMKKYEGVFCANSAENIYGKPAAGEGKIMVGENAVFSDNSYDELLGCYVNAYTRLDMNDTAYLLYMEATDTDIASCSYDEIANSSSVLSDMKLKVYRESTSRKQEYDLENDVCILYNGIISDVYTDSIFELSSGNVTLIDNDQNGKYDVVKIQVSDDIIASGYNKIAEIITSKYGAGVNISSENRCDGFKIVDTSGKEVNPESILVWDIVSAYYDKPSAYDNRKLTKVVVSKNTVSGLIESISQDSVEIEGAEYGLSPEFVSGGDLINIEAGTSGTFYLNLNGEIFAAKADMLADVETKTGILIDGAVGKGLLPEISVKIYDYTDEMITPKLADKVKLDGERYTDEECFTALAPRGKVSRQLIRYTFNAEGKINYIDTCYRGENENENTLERVHAVTDDSIRYRAGLSSFDGIYNVDVNSTKMFSQPKDITDDDSYTSAVGTLTDDGIYSADVYITGNPYCAYAVVFDEAGSSNLKETEMFLVTRVTRVIDEFDEEVYKLYVLGQSATTEFYMEEDVYNKHQVSMGDIVCFSTKNQNRISDLLVIYDLSEDKFFSETNPYGEYAANQRVIMFSPYEKKESWVSISCGEPSEVTDPRKLESRNVDKYRKYVWDIKMKTAREATAADIADYVSAGNSCSKVFISEAAAWPKMCIIYN